MPLTLGDLRTLTLQLVGNRTTDTATTTWYNTRVNNGYRRLCTFQGQVNAPGAHQPVVRRLGFFELMNKQSRNLGPSMATNFVTPSPATNVCVVTDIYDTTSKRGLDRVSLREIRGRDPSSAGIPRRWSPGGEGGVIGYYVDKLANTSSYQIAVQEYLYLYPADLVGDSAAPVIPDAWHMPIAFGAASEAALLLDMPERHRELEGRFLSYIAERKSPVEEASYGGLAGSRRSTPIGWRW